MPQATPKQIEQNLRRAQQNTLLNSQNRKNSFYERRKEELRRQMAQMAARKPGQDDQERWQEMQLNLEKELADLEKKNKPQTAIEEFGPETEIPAEGTAESTIEPPEKSAEMGAVPMEETEEEKKKKEDEESLSPMQPESTGEPVKERPTAEGGGQMPEEKKEGYFGRTKPAGEEGEATGPETPIGEKTGEKPGEEAGEAPAEAAKKESPAEEPATPSEGEQAEKITSRQMAQRNKGLTDGAKGALADKADKIYKAADLYKKYKWLVWIGGLVIANIWWIIIGVVILVLLIIVVLIVYYMVNNGVDWYTAIKCGGTEILGGDGVSCFLKRAIEKLPEAAQKAAEYTD